ncbi:MAG TPA: hypothetical protein VL359_09240, partial [bacterium]|nr:hypothetical protein [bacterium]
MLDEAIAAIWQALEAGVHYPPAWRGRLTVEQGYRVQLAILERLLQRGERQAGWKVGLTSKGIQQQVGYHEPVFGYLLVSGERSSGTVLVVGELLSPFFETELCLTVGRDLMGPGVTQEQARAALTAAAPALEIVERRGDFAADAALSMADNVQQKHFVTGPALAPLPPGLDLAAVQARVSINGQ